MLYYGKNLKKQMCCLFFGCVFVVVCLSEVLDQSSMALICKASDTNTGSES